MGSGGSGFTKEDSMCLKGIAIWLMMFHHCFMSEERFEGYAVDFAPFSQQFVVDVCGYFKICVPIFVFITGYGLYMSAKGRCTDARSTERWIGARSVKTLSGFWAVYVLVFATTQVFAGYPSGIYLEKGWISGAVYMLLDLLGLAQLSGTPTLVATWWYMSAAVVYIILVPVFVKWTGKLGYATLFCSIVVLPRCVGEGYPGGTNLFTFLPALALGMLFAQYGVFEKLDRLKGEWIQFIVYHVLLVASVAVWIKIPMHQLWEYHVGPATLIGICYCRKYVMRIPVIREGFIFCGRHSMDIFLIHSFIRTIFFEEFIYGFGHFVLIVLVLFAVSLGLSIVIGALKRWSGYDKYVDVLCKKIMG